MPMDPSQAAGYLCAVARTREAQAALLRTGHLPTLRVLASSPFLDEAVLNNLAAHKDSTVRRRALWRCTDVELLKAASKSRTEKIREAVLSNHHTPDDVLAAGVSGGSFAAALNPATPEETRRAALDSSTLHRHALTGRHLPRNAHDRRAARALALALNNPWLHELSESTAGTMRDVLRAWTEVVENGYLEQPDEQLLAGAATRSLPPFVVGVVAHRNPQHPQLLSTSMRRKGVVGHGQGLDSPYVLSRLNLAHGPRVALRWATARPLDNPGTPFSPSSDVFLPGGDEHWEVLSMWVAQNQLTPHFLDLLIALSHGWSGTLYELVLAASAI